MDAIKTLMTSDPCDRYVCMCACTDLVSQGLEHAGAADHVPVCVEVKGEESKKQAPTSNANASVLDEETRRSVKAPTAAINQRTHPSLVKMAGDVCMRFRQQLRYSRASS